MVELKRKLNIVLAEDEEIIAMAYEQGFGYMGHNIVIARDGNEAITAISKAQPDIVLLDVIMPNKNGFETLETLRQNPKYKHLPIVMLTNLSQASDKIKAETLGATDYLVKSDLTLTQLMQHIEKVLGKQ